MRTISQGFKDPEAMFLQRMLNKRGASPTLSEDADFGRRTKAAVWNPVLPILSYLPGVWAGAY